MQYLWAFTVGGLLCVIAQILIDKTKLTPARILVGYVIAGAILSALGIYEYIADFAGAGASVPLLGFGHSLIQGVEKAVDEKGLFGILSGGLIGTASGISAVMLFSFLSALLFKSRRK
ncbi:MAG: stage V sporulation protein AE [Clostridia bacterium]|nr:stage V sporulation protein AE [Clostridia bacterium]MBR4979801.1 stage V sporulation protein AE [Clostridia bacterium]